MNKIMIKDLDKEKLQHACHDVIDALHIYPTEYKIVALHMLIDGFPVPYVILDQDKIQKEAKK